MACRLRAQLEDTARSDRNLIVTTETDEEVQIAKGITCSWPVENPAPKKWTVEICWLEAYDAYKPSIGQPLPSFDRIAHALILSMRL